MEFKKSNQNQLLKDLQKQDISKLDPKQIDYYYYKLVQLNNGNKELEKLFKIISEKRDVTNKKNDGGVLKVNKEELNKHIYLYKQHDKYKLSQIKPNNSILKLPVSINVVDRLESNINRELDKIVEINEKNIIKIIIKEYSNYL